MAKWQLAYLEKERSYTSDSGVIYVDLPSDEQISMIMLDFRVNNTAPTSRDDDRSILDVVKDVHVLLEGSKSAYHAKPEVGSFMAYLIAKQLPPHNIRERGATVMRLPIYFGRYPHDEQYMLRTGDYASAQVQIEYELDTTYETTQTTQLTAWLVRPVQKLNPVGFVRSRIVNSYTSSGSAETKEVDLPTGLPWLNVGFRVWDFDNFVNRAVTDVDLDIDEGRLHIFDGRIEDLIELQKLWYGQPHAGPRYWVMSISGAQVQTFMGDVHTIQWSQLGAALVIFNSSAIWGPRYTVTMRDDAGTAISAETDYASTPFGMMPFQCLTVGNFEGDPFDAPAHADAKIEYEIGAYTALFETFVQEIVTGKL